jgi:hypothetical protein
MPLCARWYLGASVTNIDEFSRRAPGRKSGMTCWRLRQARWLLLRGFWYSCHDLSIERFGIMLSHCMIWQDSSMLPCHDLPVMARRSVHDLPVV